MFSAIANSKSVSGLLSITCQFSSIKIDEMGPGARRALRDYKFVGIRAFAFQPILNVQTCFLAFENDMPGHLAYLARAG